MKPTIIILCLSVLCFSCNNFKEISVSKVDGFYLKKINLEKIEAEINLQINNPNSIGFSIYPSEFEIIYCGIRLGKATLNKRVHINKQADKLYTFQLNSRVKDLNPLDALQLLNLSKLGKIEIKGDLKAGKFFIKKSYPINYSTSITPYF